MYQTFIAGLLLFLASFFLFLWIKRRNLNLPPSPPRLPIIGNLHQLGSLPHRTLRDLSNKYGPLMLLQLGQVPTLVATSREMAQEIFKTHEITFASRSSSKVANHIFSGNYGVIFAPYGEPWKQAKKLCVTHLLSAKMVRSFWSVKEKETELMIERISRISSSLGTVNMSEMLKWFSNNVISSAVSDKFFSDEGKKDKIRSLVYETSDVLGDFHITDFFPIVGWIDFLPSNTRARRIRKRWDDILEEIINEHATDGSSKDVVGRKNSNFVDTLLSLENDSNDFTFTRETIKAILFEMYAAGVETSHRVLEWTLAELIRNPTVMNKLQDEVRGAGRGKSLIKGEDLGNMSYLKAVIKEVMRLHMPDPLLVPRESLKSCQVGGYHIPSKTQVIINAWAIARDPTIWEEPEAFKPERFISSRVDYRGNDFEFTPFGAGRRICLGITFAAQTIELALANLVHRFHWELPGKMTIDDLDMNEAVGMVTHKKQSIELTAKLFTS